MAPVKLFLLSAPLSVGVGALSWFLVERHFLSWSASMNPKTTLAHRVAISLAAIWNTRKKLFSAGSGISTDRDAHIDRQPEIVSQTAE